MADVTPDELWKRVGPERKCNDLPIVADGFGMRFAQNGAAIIHSERKLRFVCTSDTHDQFGELKSIPDGDVFIHSGDFTNFGDPDEIRRFNDQIGLLPHKYKIIVAGNHEFGFEDDEDVGKRLEEYRGCGTAGGYSLLTNAIYLHDKLVEIEGIKIYGSSWHPLLGFSFARNRGPELAEKWKSIPNGIDLLITHTPPLGYLDVYAAGYQNSFRQGCFDLLQTVERIQPKYHIFGHIHDCHGVATNGVTTFINAAICNDAMIIANRPIVFDYPIR